MIGRQARPCMNLFVMYRCFSVVPQGLDVFFPFILFGDFQSFFLAISWSDFEAFLFGIWWGMYS
jgi:hypothetical protein